MVCDLRSPAALALWLLPFLSSAQLQEADDQAAVSLDRFSLAVLPVENLGTGPELAFVEAALNQDFLLGVRSINGLNVIEPHRLSAYDDQELAPVDIARQLGVGAIVIGSLHENDQGLNIELQQIDGTSGDVTWTAGTAMFSPTAAEVEAVLPRIVAQAVRSVRISIQGPQERNDLQSARDAQAIILNTGIDERERLRAYSQLRFREDEPIDAVIAAIAEIGSSSHNPNVRRNAWIALVGADNTVLVEPLLRSLGYDPDSAVRRVAAEVLTEYLGESGVREALTYASINDEAETVRDHVQLLLLPEAERRNVRRAEVLDVNLPDEARFDALVDYSGAGRLAGGRILEIDDDVAVAAIQLALTSSDPRIRGQVWSYLAAVDNGYLVDALLQQLADDPSESVRESAADYLRSHLDEPGVREALDHSSSNDPSLAVRRQAESVLKGR